MLTYLIVGVIGLGVVAVIVSQVQKNRDRSASQGDSSGYAGGAYWMSGDESGSDRHHSGDGHDHGGGFDGGGSDGGGGDAGGGDSGGGGDGGGGGGSD